MEGSNESGGNEGKAGEIQVRVVLLKFCKSFPDHG